MANRRYKIADSAEMLLPSPPVVMVNGEIVRDPGEEILHRFGFRPLADIAAPEVPDDGSLLKVKYEYRDSDGKVVENSRKAKEIYPVYEVIPPPPPPPPPPRIFSKLRITAALMKLEKWIPVRDFLVQTGMYDLYLAAQDFKEDDEFFVKGLTELKAQFGMSDEEVEAILAEGEV